MILHNIVDDMLGLSCFSFCTTHLLTNIVQSINFIFHLKLVLLINFDMHKEIGIFYISGREKAKEMARVYGQKEYETEMQYCV